MIIRLPGEYPVCCWRRGSGIFPLRAYHGNSTLRYGTLLSWSPHRLSHDLLLTPAGCASTEAFFTEAVGIMLAYHCGDSGPERPQWTSSQGILV